MMKSAIVALIAVLMVGTVSVSAEQSGDYITVKKSDLPPDVLKKVQIAQATKEAWPTTTYKGQWFFVVRSTAVAVIGPFRDQTDCEELKAFMKIGMVKNYASRCWYSGD